MIIRREEKEDIRVVEELIRDAFWNVYGPGATEHYVAHRLRSHKDFVKEHEYKHVIIKSGRYKNGIYHLNHINA